MTQPSKSKLDLVYFEKAQGYACLQGNLNTMGIAFIEKKDDDESTHTVDSKLFHEILVYMHRRHPYLRACLEHIQLENRLGLSIMDEESSLTKLDYEYLDLTKEPYNRDRLMDELARFNARLFTCNTKTLLWRCQLLAYMHDSRPKYIMSISLFNSITDGINIMTLSIEMVNILNALLTNRECLEMREKLEPADNLYVNSQKCNLFKPEHLQTIEKIGKITQGVDNFFPDNFRSQTERGFKLDLYKFDRQTTSQITKRCKEHGIRMNAYLNMVSFYTLRQLFEENGCRLREKLLICVPISLRVRYEPNFEFAQCRPQMISVGLVTNQIKFEKFWDDCQTIEKETREMVNSETGALFSSSHSFNYFDKLNESFNKATNSEQSNSLIKTFYMVDFVMSNLGKFVNDRKKVFEGPFDLKELYCSDSLCIDAPPAIVIHVFFWRGELFIQFGACKMKFRSFYCDRFNELFKQTVLETSK